MIDRRTTWRQEAQEHVGTATTIYHEMDMRFWLEQAEAHRGALGGGYGIRSAN